MWISHQDASHPFSGPRVWLACRQSLSSFLSLLRVLVSDQVLGELDLNLDLLPLLYEKVEKAMTFSVSVFLSVK